MDENKNIGTENGLDSINENETINEIPVEDTEDNKTEVSTEEKATKKKKDKKPKKAKKLKNQALLRRGGYSIAITAAVLAALIVLNVLVIALSKRFNLEFDMSAEKNNSVSQENLDFIKKVKSDVSVVICAKEDNYVTYISSVAQAKGVTTDASDYFKQTVKLINKYGDLNSKIKVRFVDTQDSSFTEISTKYSNEKLNFGDIIVSSGSDDKERYKLITFEDVYELKQDDTYASYGYSTSTVSGNNIETALTSAISYVTSTKTKKVALLTGHSSTDNSDEYQKLLKTNNYDIVTISDAMVNAIPTDCDAVIIASPTTDFMGNELDAISKFLDNGGKLSKGLLFFADASAPYLTNLYDFLGQWGIQVDEGILFETNSNNHMPDDPMTLGSYVEGTDKITSGMKLCITGYNVPLTGMKDVKNSRTVTTLMATPESVVAAPVGTSATWSGAGDYTKKVYSTVIQSEQKDYDSDNNAISSYVMAFSSTEFLKSQYSEQQGVSNKNIIYSAAERAVGAENTGISFVAKTITNESYQDKVTALSTNIIKIIFMVLLPVLSLVAGIYIFIRRKNS